MLLLMYDTSDRQTHTHTHTEYGLLCFQFTKWFHTIYQYLSISNLSSISISLSISHFFSVSGEYLGSAHLGMCLSISYMLLFNYCMAIPYWNILFLKIHSSVDRHLHCFNFSLITNNKVFFVGIFKLVYVLKSFFRG